MGARMGCPAGATSIRGESPSRRGNKALKRAFFLAAFAALKDPASRTSYDRKIAQGKRHNQALLCVARRRCDVIYATLTNGTFYQPTPTPSLTKAIGGTRRPTNHP